jgi:hypothetical protein
MMVVRGSAFGGGGFGADGGVRGPGKELGATGAKDNMDRFGEVGFVVSGLAPGLEHGLPMAVI